MVLESTDPSSNRVVTSSNIVEPSFFKSRFSNEVRLVKSKQVVLFFETEELGNSQVKKRTNFQKGHTYQMSAFATNEKSVLPCVYSLK